MRLRTAWTLPLIVAALLSGCYSGPGTASKGDAALAVATPFDGDVPDGVVTPKPVVGAYIGIFRQQGAEPCCWITQEASFQSRLTPHAKALFLTVVLPPLTIYRDRPQSLVVRIPGQPATTFKNLQIGESTLRVPLEHPATRMITVSLHAGYAFVPKRENINGDNRLLAMYLTGIRSK